MSSGSRHLPEARLAAWGGEVLQTLKHHLSSPSPCRTPHSLLSTLKELEMDFGPNTYEALLSCEQERCHGLLEIADPVLCALVKDLWAARKEPGMFLLLMTATDNSNWIGNSATMATTTTTTTTTTTIDDSIPPPTTISRPWAIVHSSWRELAYLSPAFKKMKCEETLLRFLCEFKAEPHGDLVFGLDPTLPVSEIIKLLRCTDESPSRLLFHDVCIESSLGTDELDKFVVMTGTTESLVAAFALHCARSRINVGVGTTNAVLQQPFRAMELISWWDSLTTLSREAMVDLGPRFSHMDGSALVNALRSARPGDSWIYERAISEMSAAVLLEEETREQAAKTTRALNLALKRTKRKEESQLEALRASVAHDFVTEILSSAVQSSVTAAVQKPAPGFMPPIDEDAIASSSTSSSVPVSRARRASSTSTWSGTCGDDSTDGSGTFAGDTVLKNKQRKKGKRRTTHHQSPAALLLLAHAKSNGVTIKEEEPEEPPELPLPLPLPPLPPLPVVAPPSPPIPSNNDVAVPLHSVDDNMIATAPIIIAPESLPPESPIPQIQPPQLFHHEITLNPTPTTIDLTPSLPNNNNVIGQQPQPPIQQHDIIIPILDPLSHAKMALNIEIKEMALALDMVAQRRRPWQLAVAEKVKQAVYAIWPGSYCDVFGSLASGLAAPCSDVDMVVRGVSQHDRVWVLSDYLQRQDWVQMLHAVAHTAVPVIKFATAAIPISFGNLGNLIMVDITFENERHHGLNTCGLVRDLVNRWAPLKPLVLVLKQFLVEKGLNDPYTGGLSSYGLVLMVTAVLSRYHHQGGGSDDLGHLFVEFLRCYSLQDFIQHGVSLSGEIGRRPLHDPFYIEDPLDKFNNVGKSCFGISQVVATFAEALDSLIRSSLTTGNGGGGVMIQEWSYLGRVFSTGHHRQVVDFVTNVWCPLEVTTTHAPTIANQPTAFFPAQQQQPISQKPLLPTNKGEQRVTPSSTVSSDGVSSRRSSVVKQPVTSPTSPTLPAMTAWMQTSKDVLEMLANEIQAGTLQECPICKTTMPHAPSCALMNVLTSWPSQ